MVAKNRPRLATNIIFTTGLISLLSTIIGFCNSSYIILYPQLTDIHLLQGTLKFYLYLQKETKERKLCQGKRNSSWFTVYIPVCHGV